jgi:hypothetical protein
VELESSNADWACRFMAATMMGFRISGVFPEFSSCVSSKFRHPERSEGPPHFASSPRCQQQSHAKLIQQHVYYERYCHLKQNAGVLRFAQDDDILGK